MAYRAKVENGVVTAVWFADTPLTQAWNDCGAQRPQIGWAFDGTSYTQPKPQQITATAFLNRIPPAVLPVLWGNPQTGVLLITLAAANMIDLTDPSVIAGINALVPAILTAAQASAILDR
jgi:hypothetical protein